MIYLKELIKDHHVPDEDAKSNLNRLHYCLNYIRFHFKKPIVVTRAFVTLDEQVKLYEAINTERLAQGKPQIAPKTKSFHLLGAAADLDDSKGELKDWVLKNAYTVETLLLHFEDFESTPKHLHIQIYPPESGKRFFKP